MQFDVHNQWGRHCDILFRLIRRILLFAALSELVTDVLLVLEGHVDWLHLRDIRLSHEALATVEQTDFLLAQLNLPLLDYNVE